MTLFILFSILLLTLYILLILYYSRGWNTIPAFADQMFSTTHSTQVSVIISARNEAINIKACLETVTDQSYPANLFEILVVDDHSTDNTAAIVRSFPAQNVKLISLKEYIAGGELNSYKKKAIEIGIQQSNGKLIVTTDADCLVPKSWLQTMVSFYEKYHPAFIAAPVAIDCGFNFIEMFQALDFMVLQGITGASVHKNTHSMCNGANLAYERSAFYEVDGFKGIDAIASGDDMLLMHKIYKRFPERVMFLKSNEAIVHTGPLKTARAFFNQRIRWASKADKYDDKRILAVLVIVYLFNVMLLALPVAAIFFHFSFFVFHIRCSPVEVWLLLLILKTIAELIFLFPVAGFYNKRYLLWFFPVMQPFHIMYTIVAGWLGKFGSYNWKGRKVK